MEDKEFYERLTVLIDELMAGIGAIALQDYENLNLASIELSKRNHASGGRKLKDLPRSFQTA